MREFIWNLKCLWWSRKRETEEERGMPIYNQEEALAAMKEVAIVAWEASQDVEKYLTREEFLASLFPNKEEQVKE